MSPPITISWRFISRFLVRKIFSLRSVTRSSRLRTFSSFCSSAVCEGAAGTAAGAGAVAWAATANGWTASNRAAVRKSRITFTLIPRLRARGSTEQDSPYTIRGARRAPDEAPPTPPGPKQLAALLELGQHELGDRLQRLEDPHAGRCDGLVLRNVPRVEQPVELVDGRDVRKVAFVVLDHVRDLVEVVALLGEVHSQVLDRLDVGLHPLDLRVRDEDDPVHALQDQLPARVVEHLAGDRVEVEARLEAADLAEREREEVEEERALRLGREGDHLALRVRVRLRVDVLQVGRLPAEAGAVIDDLAVDLARAVVDEAHGYSLKRLSMSSSVISANGLCAPGVACFFASDSNTRASSSPAFFTRSRTSPSELFASKITTRTTRPATMLMWSDSRSPS